MRLTKPVVRLIVMACTTLAVLALPGTAFAAAHYIYHERTGNDATEGDHANCSSAEPYVDILSPGPGQAVTLRFKVEYQFYTDRLALYYTTDGSHPDGYFGTAGIATYVVTPTYTCTFGSGGTVVDICTATIPAQPAGTTVKYVISAWQDAEQIEIFANSGVCNNCNSFNDATSCQALITYLTVVPAG